MRTLEEINAEETRDDQASFVNNLVAHFEDFLQREIFHAAYDLGEHMLNEISEHRRGEPPEWTNETARAVISQLQESLQACVLSGFEDVFRHIEICTTAEMKAHNAKQRAVFPVPR